MSDQLDDVPSLGGSDPGTRDVHLSGAQIIASALAEIERFDESIAAQMRQQLDAKGSRVPLIQLVAESLTYTGQRDMGRACLKILREVARGNQDPALHRQIIEIINPLEGRYDGGWMDIIVYNFARIGIDLPALIREGYAHEDDRIYWAAAHFLRGTDDEAVLIEALSHPSQVARKWALMHTLVNHVTSKVLARIMDIMINDPDLNLRVSAAYDLVRIKSPDTIPVLREQLHQAEFHYIHGPVIQALTALEDRESMPDIMRAMRLAAERIQLGGYVQSEYSILGWGMDAIAVMGDASGMDIVLDQLISKWPERRMDAIYAMKHLAQRDPSLLPQVIPLIASRLKDDERGYGYDVGLGTPVNQRAREALQEIGTPEALAELSQFDKGTRKDS
jgi:hypothetical protein